MKIGILTFNCVFNYGAVIQAFALQNELESDGHNVEMIDLQLDRLKENYKLLNLTNFAFSNKCIIQFLSEVKKIPCRVIRYLKFNRDVHQLLNLTESKYRTIEELIDGNLDHDVFVCGSDQIWNPQIFNGPNPIFFADFAKPNQRKISYAASIGVENIDKNFIEDYVKYINHLDNISVREIEAKEEFQNLIKNDISIVLDPVFLLKKEQWAKLITKQIEASKYILIYMLRYDKELLDLATNISKERNLKIVIIGERSRSFRGDNIKYYSTAGPLDFLNLFFYSSSIVTNSFHGTAFSIIFEKEIFTFANDKRNSRIINLMNKLDLGNRIVNSSNDFKKGPIDYTKVNKLLGVERKKSIEFLKKAVN
ncbi:MAG: polysaccharide pyruvyl transferase family protein [Candidatus Delongbacteria bacterium]|nr:polysaccharide pyruvyl transferase family protein [Candidatus Delongbacteria bacterium]